MQVVRTRRAMQETSSRWRRDDVRIGFVPTMGALHAGHLSLLERLRDCDRIVVSIFVNPTQFGPGEDLERYPRDLDGDCDKLRAAGCSVVFAPEADDMYGAEPRTSVIVEGFEDVLCGASRPGHFRGVATVVAKLFHVVQPHAAVFGQKDAQQALVLQRMVRDLDFDIELRVAPIVRDPDGLALSSRNAYLGDSERSEALLLHEALEHVRTQLLGGERDAHVLRRALRAVLERGTTLRVDYAEIVDPATLKPVSRLDGRVLCAVAAVVGSTRLIDNLVLDVTGDSVHEVLLDAPPPTNPGRTNATT